jgi:hypothetical protein
MLYMQQVRVSVDHHVSALGLGSELGGGDVFLAGQVARPPAGPRGSKITGGPGAYAARSSDQPAAKDPLDAELVQLAVDFVAQPLIVRTAQDVVSDIDQHHVLVWPGGRELPGQLDAHRASPDQHDSTGPLQSRIHTAVAID